jgi:bacterioferritin-associated ferredoxin
VALICHCEAIRERTIVKAIRHGATTLADVRSICGAATSCEGCTDAVCELIERHAPERAMSSSPKLAARAG